MKEQFNQDKLNAYPIIFGIVLFVVLKGSLK